MIFDNKIVVATTNKGKLREIKDIFSVSGFDDKKLRIFSLADYGEIEEADEPHKSFSGNAIHKAKYYSQHTKAITLSEDSGLCIDALNDFPGVDTKLFMEECGGIQKAFIKLEEMLSDYKNYKAYFICSAALYIPQKSCLITNEEKVYGCITFPPRGDKGHAFDPIFVPEKYDKTFAELGEEVKNKISHRSLAIKGIIEKFKVMLQGRM